MLLPPCVHLTQKQKKPYSRKARADARPSAPPNASSRPSPRVRRRRPPFTTGRKVATAARAVQSQATMGVRRRRIATGAGTGRWRGSGKQRLGPGKNEGSGLALRKSRKTGLLLGGAGLGLGVGLRRRC